MEESASISEPLHHIPVHAILKHTLARLGDKSAVKLLMESDEDEEGYICRVCQRVYTTERGLQRHERETGHIQNIPRIKSSSPKTAVVAAPRNFKCKFCDKAYNAQKGLSRHMIEFGHGAKKVSVSLFTTFSSFS